VKKPKKKEIHIPDHDHHDLKPEHKHELVRTRLILAGFDLAKEFGYDYDQQLKVSVFTQHA
jgi:hypothetical protein